MSESEQRFDEMCEHISRLDRSRLWWKVVALLEGGLLVFLLLFGITMTGFMRLSAAQQQRMAEDARREAIMQRELAEQQRQEAMKAAAKQDQPK